MSTATLQLSESIKIAKTLKEQNEKLKLAFNDLKCEYVLIEGELINLKKEYETEIELKKSLEIDCKNLYKKWNQELKIQAKEFEKLQSEMIPNTELNLLRIKILNELEISYNEKLNFMKNEMEKYQSLYNKIFKKYEILKINNKNQDNLFNNLLNEKQEILNIKINKLKKENKQLKNEINLNILNIDKNNEKQKYQTKNIKLNQEINLLIKQKSSLNEKNKKLNLEIEEIKCQNIENIKKYQGLLLIKETECNGLEKKYNHLLNEFNVNKENQILKQQKIDKLENNEINLKNIINSKQNEIKHLNESLNKKEINIKQKFNQEIKNLNEKIKNEENKIYKKNQENENLKIKINNLENKHLIEIQQIKQENFTNLNKLIESKQDIEEKYHELKEKYINLQTKNNKMIDKLSKDLDLKIIKTKQIETNKINLIQENKKYENEILDYLNDIKCLKKENVEINNQYQILTNKYRNILDLNYKLTTNENKYLLQIESLTNDINEIDKNIENKLKNLKINYENKINKMNENKENNDKIMNKLKKEKQKYKKLVTTTKLKINCLSKELNNIKKNYQTELKSKIFEINSLNKQLNEIQRQRDEIKFRLTMDHQNNNNNNSLQTNIVNNNDVDLLLSQLQIEQQEQEQQEQEQQEQEH